MSNNLDTTTITEGGVSPWGKVIELLKTSMDPETYDLWLKPVRQVSFDGTRLVLGVPNRFFNDWILNHCKDKMESALRELAGPQATLELVIFQDQQLPPQEAPVAEPQIQIAVPEAPLPGVEFFNPKYTFETFIEGQANRFAKAAAEGISKEPGIRFNPFFLYGGVGLGKTHLMHAIGHAIRHNYPKARILYITSEKFINEFIDSLRFERPADFRNKYRNLDCLLIDDIQFLMGKGRSEEEFFYTFNTLFDSRKQIVISSDRAPKEMGALTDRLISRFEWGVVADIQPPDLETRIAILRKKAEMERLHVPDDVILFVASQVKSNIRELEGSLIRIVAFSSLTATPLTVDTARATLRDILKHEEAQRPITIEAIQEVVAKHFNLEMRELKSKRRTDAIAWPRQIAMYLARILTELSTTEIGESFGKDHTTVLHACDKVKMKLAESPFISSLVNKITQEIKNQNESESA
ncbi:MAG: hypothetical protein A2901_09585 [Elusimicrobia bacterium RIFCSPLOWO2_01_FULL_54_10]|nr:MAG: hypothetical protein A2901_09585 [Elusimicrobia bacterium RIFCSPLOWO2_01_FULL_54_10]